MQLKQYNNFLLDEDYPPSEYTEFLYVCAFCFIKQRHKDRKIVVAEIGAKEGIVGISLSPLLHKLVATEICKYRQSLLEHNMKHAKSGFMVLPSNDGAWFPSSYNWHNVNLFLFNPPSVPEPNYHNIPDNRMYFSGKYGRNDIEAIIDGLSINMNKSANAIIVAAEYITNNWLKQKCQANRLNCTELQSAPVRFKEGSIDWHIKTHVENVLGFFGYSHDQENNQFSYTMKGWLISHA